MLCGKSPDRQDVRLTTGSCCFRVNTRSSIGIASGRGMCSVRLIEGRPAFVVARGRPCSASGTTRLTYYVDGKPIREIRKREKECDRWGQVASGQPIPPCGHQP